MKLWPTKNSASLGWTAVDAGAEGICGASVRMSGANGGKPQVVKCAVVNEPELGAEALSRLAKMIAVPQFPWTMPLGRGEYKMMVLPEPAVKPAEMIDSLRWSLGTMLDFPAEEATLDWMPIPTLKHLPQRPQNLYAIVARKDVVQRRAEPFRQMKMNLGAVDIRETAQRNIAVLLEKPGEALGMVSINPQGVEITFTFEGELYLDRFIEEPLATAIAGNDDSRNRMFERITLQVQRSLDFVHRTLPFMPVGRIVIAPLPAPIALRDYLAQNIAEPVEVMDLASVFDFSLTPELMAEEAQARYFTALGATLRGTGEGE